MSALLMIELSRYGETGLDQRVLLTYCHYNILIQSFTGSLAKILKLVDHKGCLEVTWDISPSVFQQYAIKLAWEFAGEYNIIHQTRKL